jgi:excisionase family DNA binding protein
MINHLDKEGGRLAVSVEDAAAMVGIGRTTLYAALGDRSLRSLKIGRPTHPYRRPEGLDCRS